MRNREPIAIIGFGCRMPGAASDPESLWNLLLQGVDAICPIPRERWDIRRYYDPDPDRPGKIYIREGGFLREPIDRFDALAFGISPREALYMDPQQRVMLEVTWEALDDAGIPQESLRGKPVGVFVGGFTLDSMVTQYSYENQHLLASHSASGTSMTMLSNRISHVFDFRGPSVSMDTACSSSLIATHFACRSLWNGDCSIAITGGVNIMSRPGLAIAMCKGGFLSPLARCTSFDERAAGYARGEGAGAAILKPLSAALRDGDRIYAMILATGANQDGRTPGISLPNRDAQIALIRRVLAEAEVEPAQVRYVEAHGTGTQAGDLAEAGALHEVLREDRDAGDKVIVGSIKTNIGHLEAAAGIAGLMKAALCLHHSAVPKNLHFERPNPAIPFADMCIEVPVEIKPLQGDTPALASVNSFGYGGANAHVLLSQVHAQPALSGRPERTGYFGLPVSARDAAALGQRAQSLADFLTAHPEISLADLGYTAAHRSSHHNHRLMVIAQHRDELIHRLREIAAGRRVEGAVIGQHPSRRPKLAFVYSGMGPQWWAMGRELMQREPVYAQAIEEVDELFGPLAGWSLKQALLADEARSEISKTRVAQPTNFALQYALTKLWRSFGIEPDAVVGHSVGEVASTWASGALSLEDSVRVSFHRSRLQQAMAIRGIRRGAMLAAGIGEEAASALLAVYRGVSIAAINSAQSITFSGDPEAMEALAAHLEKEGLFHRILDVEVAYHSHHMDPVRDDLASALADIRPQPETTPLYSTVTGARISGQAIDAAYWCNNMREPVRFRAAIQSLLDDGYRTFVEVGPHPVLRTSIAETIAELGVEGQILPSLRRQEPEVARMLETLGALYVQGFTPAWDAVCPTSGRFVRLPKYPWQRAHFWSESDLSRAVVVGNDTHALLQTRQDAPIPTWRSELSTQFLPWLPDHAIMSAVVLPGAAYIEAALAMAQVVATERASAERVSEEVPPIVIVLEDIDFHRLLSLEDQQRVIDIQLACDLAGRRWSIASSERGAYRWTQHASGAAFAATADRDRPRLDLDLGSLQARLGGARPPVHGYVQRLYADLADLGLEYGPTFRTIASIYPGDREALVELALPAQEYAEGYLVHPALLDGAFQACIALLGSQAGAAPLVPIGADRIAFYEPVGSRAWAYIKLIRHTPREVQADISLIRDTGAICATLSGLTLRPMPVADNAEAFTDYAFVWQEKPVVDGELAKATVLVIGDENAIERLSGPLLARGSTLLGACFGERFERRNAEVFKVAPDALDSVLAPLRDHRFDHVVVLVPRPSEQPVADLERLGVGILSLARGLAAEHAHATLTLVTCLGRDLAPDLVGSSLTSMLRVIRSEHAALVTRAIELGSDDRAAWDRVADEVLAGNDEPEVRLRPDGRDVRRLEPVRTAPKTAATMAKTIKVRTDQAAVKLAMDQVGVLSTIHYDLTERRRPGPTEVEIRIEAASLNFKDLLKFAGQLDPRVTRNTYFGDSYGMDCVGVVEAVGSSVTRFRVGDRVVAMPASGCFASFATTDESTVIPLPGTLSPVQAVSLFTPYLTAWHSLANVARLEPGETVLIHSAAGGVGYIAVQIAKMLGATVFATVGTEEKRAFLRSKGIEHISDSRSLAFVDDIKRWTNGRGVDVVLSAVAGEALVESVRVMARYGRFVDIGKRMLIENEPLPLRMFNEGLTYAAVDMDRMFRDRAKFCLDIIAGGLRAAAEGKIELPPTRVFAANDIVDALHTMAQGQHIGRLVINYDRTEVEARDMPAAAQPIVRADGTYVVTGGLDGFGLEVARWLADQGAGGLVLMSRRGGATQGAAQALADLQARGVKVLAEAVDVADRRALAAALDRARAALPAIRGVFHCAMVLDDRFIEDMTRDSFARVLAPKALGAWHLHELTQSDPLDCFVGFSSVAVALGNPGQASYVAANGFLDALAEHRRIAGKPALSIQWGVLGEVGVVTRNRTVGDVLEGTGILALTTREALQGLSRALSSGRAQVGVFSMDWQRWTETQPDLAARPIYAKVRSGALALSSPILGLCREYLAVDPEDWVAEVSRRLRERIAELLHVEAEHLGLEQSLTELGIDSLLAVELVNSLGPKGYPLKTVELMRGPTIRELAERIAAAMVAALDSHGSELAKSADELSADESRRLAGILSR